MYAYIAFQALFNVLNIGHCLLVGSLTARIGFRLSTPAHQWIVHKWFQHRHKRWHLILHNFHCYLAASSVSAFDAEWTHCMRHIMRQSKRHHFSYLK